MNENQPQWDSLLAAFAPSEKLRAELTIENTPAPSRLATHTSALLADVEIGGLEVGNGRLVLLYEPTYQTEWEGNLRLVGYTRADLEEELVTDSLLLEVGWSWVTDSFRNFGLTPVALSGTVSRSGNQSFGDISNRPPTGAIEIRSSWTVSDLNSLSDHVSAWLDLLCLSCGLEPLPSSVTSIRPS